MNQEKCCPQFNIERWDNKTFNWDNKGFIKESIPTFFHMPLPSMIGKKIGRMWNMAKESGMNPPDEDVLILFNDPSAFKSDLYLTVNGNVPNANNVKLSGTFIAKVFDGPYNAIPKFIKEMEQYLGDKKAKDYFIHYAYCPKCAKEYGHNYMILFAKIN